MEQSQDDLPLDKARFRTRSDGEILHRLDLRIDFIPLIHIGHTVSDGKYFGHSSLAKLMQALDELADRPATRPGGRPVLTSLPDFSSARTLPQTAPGSSTTSSRLSQRACCRWRPASECFRRPGIPSPT